MSSYKNEIPHLVRILEKGGVILYPTDTIWGLGCDATNEASIDRIFRLKKRSLSKSMIILARDEQMIRQYTNLPGEKLLEMMRDADTPTTGIFKHAKNLPPNLIGNDGSIGIRIPSDPFCAELLRAFGKPIVSTSANISQHASPQNFLEINPQLIWEVDYTVLHRRDDETKKSPSHIIRLNEEGIPERLR